MYSFNNDYSECVHPKILDAIVSMNGEQNLGYGVDEQSENTRQIIRQKLKKEDAQIHFLPGGTITNLTFISHALRTYEAVIAASTGHINVHETGAIEATGHKVIAIKTTDGKLTPELIIPVLKEHTDEHAVKPAMVYLSNTTEVGTVYTIDEIMALSQFCKQNSLYLYLDGARLSMGLAVEEAGVNFENLAEHLDAFYIGGTKCGAMFGEALVILNDRLKQNFRFHMKQHGAMMAKGWIVALQFQVLFTDNLYEEIGKHCNEMAGLLSAFFESRGYSFFTPSNTNQIFPILPNHVIRRMREEYIASDWAVIDETHTAVRFCTSYATKREEIERFCERFEEFI